MHGESWIDEALTALSAKGLERHPVTLHRAVDRESLAGSTSPILNFASNDYLGLSRHPAVIEAAISAIRESGAGVCSARLLAGTTDWHRELEEALAPFLGQESALVFGAGYLANCGALPAAVERGDLLLADR